MLKRDARGYEGGARNRTLSPGDVWQARKSVFDGATRAPQWAERFGMSVDSVRRMLRGDTYRDLPMPGDAEALPDAPESVAGSAELQEALSIASGGLVPKVAPRRMHNPLFDEPAEDELAGATAAFADDVKRERKQSSDGMPEELAKGHEAPGEGRS